jgi:hypothetical protein
MGLAFLEELFLVESAPNCFPAHGKEQHPPQELADLLDAQVGMTTLQLDDFRLHRGRHFRPPTAAAPRLGL